VKEPIPFTDALQAHYPDALRYCRGLCARESAADAEDVLQDALLNALRSYARLRDPDSFRAWLFTIITRSFQTHLRRSFWRRVVPLALPGVEEAIPALYSREPDIEQRLVLQGALARIGDRDRTVVLLHEVAGFSVGEIAEMCGYRSLSAVKSRLSRARMRLRDILTEHDESPGPAPRPAVPAESNTSMEIDYAY
jgi:RNA polymerase sigma-70 factor, ECF subfamily